MLEINKDIYILLNQLNANIIKTQVKDWANMPTITYALNNSRDLNLKYSEVVYLINVWDNKDLTTLINSIDEIFANVGFSRIFGSDIPDDNLNHFVLKYRGVINKNDNLIRQ